MCQLYIPSSLNQDLWTSSNFSKHSGRPFGGRYVIISRLGDTVKFFILAGTTGSWAPPGKHLSSTKLKHNRNHKYFSFQLFTPKIIQLHNELISTTTYVYIYTYGKVTAWEVIRQLALIRLSSSLAVCVTRCATFPGHLYAYGTNAKQSVWLNTSKSQREREELNHRIQQFCTNSFGWIK